MYIYYVAIHILCIVIYFVIIVYMLCSYMTLTMSIYVEFSLNDFDIKTINRKIHDACLYIYISYVCRIAYM